MANEMDQFKNMPKEPQLSDKESLEEWNRINKEEQEKASLTIESTKEWTQDLLWRLNPNEKEDIARIKAMEAADNNEINLDIWFDNVSNALVSDINIASISYEDKNKENPNIDSWKNSIESQELSTENQEDEKVVSENKEQKLSLEKFKDNPSFPIIERFMNIEVGDWKKMQLLTENDLLQLSNSIWSNDDELQGLKNWIKNIEFDDDRTQTVLDNYLYTIENINEPIQVDSEWKYSLPEDFKWEGKKILSENIDNDVVQLIIKNYKKFPDWEDWNPNVEKDIFTSCEVTLNKIIENKNFPKTEMYESAVKDVRNWDLDERIEALQYINSLVNTQEGMKWWKAKLSIKGLKETHNLSKKSYIEFKEKQILTQINWTEDNKEKEKLQWELTELLKNNEVEDKFEWEVISWWKYDVHNEKNIWEWNDNK